MRVKIIRRKGGTVLVEWVGTDGTDRAGVYGRSILPAAEVQGRAGEMAAHEEPTAGIPYGEPWDELLLEAGLPEWTAAVIANELRRVGIWTLADLQANAQDALAAFQRGYGMDVQRLRAAARAR